MISSIGMFRNGEDIPELKPNQFQVQYDLITWIYEGRKGARRFLLAVFDPQIDGNRLEGRYPYYYIG